MWRDLIAQLADRQLSVLVRIANKAIMIRDPYMYLLPIAEVAKWIVGFRQHAAECIVITQLFL